MPLLHLPKKRKKKNEMRVDTLGPLRADVIFSGLSRDSENIGATLENKEHDMDHSAFANKIVTQTETSKSPEKIGIKVSVSTLCRDSQRPADATLPRCGPPSFF